MMSLMPNKAAEFGFGTPFAEQIAFLRQKLNLPTERWDDIERMAHDRAFIVAGVLKADLLADFHRAIEKGASQGLGITEWRKDFKQIVFNHGWTGWTGEGTKAGEAWRTKVIYQTNMSTSYAAGRWAQLNDPDLLAVRPYWQYHHRDGVLHPRPLHQSWNGLTLPHDHVFWKTHFGPNGWGCHCYVTAVDGKVFASAQAAGKGTPPAGWNIINPKTGAPVGIDKGFDYAFGANTDTSLRQMVQDKLIGYPPAISKALSYDVSKYVNATQSAATFAKEVLMDTQRTDPLWLGFVDSFAEIKAQTQIDTQGYMVMLPAEAVRHVESSHGNDGGSQRAATPSDYALVWQVLSEFDRIQLSDKKSMHGQDMIVVWKKIGNDFFRCVFEVRPGKKNRAVALWSLVIKTQ
jgi:hypothetical protein